MSEQFIQCYHRSAGNNLPIIRLVVHATCPGMACPQAAATGEAVDTAHYFQQPSSGGSAHHVADINATVRCASDSTICWHAPPNAHSLGYEIGGEVSYSRAQWLSPSVWPAVEHIAALIRHDAAAYGVPLRRLTVAEVASNAKGICGHIDVSQAFHESDHTDPGPNFPWDAFMHLLGTVTPTHSPQPAAPAAPMPPAWYHRALRYTQGQPLTTGADVKTVQQKVGFVGRAVDGKYGPATASRVAAFQKTKHLSPDGIVGPDTARAIG